MDEMQRREAYEALQRNHRNDWLKQTGLKPLETKPLPQLIAEKQAEDTSTAAPSDENKSYEIPVEQNVDDSLSFQFDTHSQGDPFQATDGVPAPPPQNEPSVADAPAVDVVKPVDAPSQQTAPAQQASEYYADTKPTPAKTEPSSAKNGDDSVIARAEPKNDSDQRSPEAKASHEEQEKARAEFKAMASDSRAALREQAKADFQNDQKWKVGQGNGFDARRFGGILPNINQGANPEDVAAAVGAVADAGGLNAAATVAALLTIVDKLNDATRRIAAIERMARDGAS
jgi:hypothetical protein